MLFKSITIRNFEDVKIELANKDVFFGLNDVRKLIFFMLSGLF